MSGLFREKAKENYSEQFSVDRNISKINIPAYVFSALFVIGIVLAGVWLFCGNIATTVEISGIVYPADGIKNIVANNDGIVTGISVKKGDSVSIGDTIALMPSDDVLTQLANQSDTNNIENLRKQYENNSVIKSQYTGTVYYAVPSGKYVKKGDVIAAVASVRNDDNTRQIYALVPTSSKENIKSGCKVQVSPDFAPREKYGYLNGYVSFVDENITDSENIDEAYKAYNTSSLIQEGESYVAVHIALVADSSTESGLNWSNKKSGSLDVEMGTVCDASVVISEKTPFEWLFGGVLQ